jgi:hypothetical protein
VRAACSVHTCNIQHVIWAVGKASNLLLEMLLASLHQADHGPVTSCSPKQQLHMFSVDHISIHRAVLYSTWCQFTCCSIAYHRVRSLACRGRVSLLAVLLKCCCFYIAAGVRSNTRGSTMAAAAAARANTGRALHALLQQQQHNKQSVGSTTSARCRLRRSQGCKVGISDTSSSGST